MLSCFKQMTDKKSCVMNHKSDKCNDMTKNSALWRRNVWWQWVSFKKHCHRHKRCQLSSQLSSLIPLYSFRLIHITQPVALIYTYLDTVSHSWTHLTTFGLIWTYLAIFKLIGTHLNSYQMCETQCTQQALTQCHRAPLGGNMTFYLISYC